MRDYEKLVKKLRYCSKPGNCNLRCHRFSFAEDCLGKLTRDAADAIEELLKEKARLENSGKLLVAAFARLKEKVPKWISVEERLPEIGRIVLTSDGEDVWTNWMLRVGNKGIVEIQWAFNEEEVTHWMPLPESPKEE